MRIRKLPGAAIISPLPFPRVYPIVDTSSLQGQGWPAAGFAAELLDAGAEMLQFRHKAFWDRQAVAVLEAVASLCQRYRRPLIVNDRADFALLFDAGLHVGQEDLPPALARQVIGPERMLGFSTHNENQLREAAAEPVDYLAVGPVFSTSSKAKPDPELGLGALPRLRALTGKPLVAIGGITLATAADVLAAGADSVALIGGLIPDGYAPGSARARMEAWLTATK